MPIANGSRLTHVLRGYRVKSGKLLGRSNNDGPPQEITIGDNLTLEDGVLSGEAGSGTPGEGIEVTAEIDVASAATCDIGGVDSDNVRITGVVTITSFGTSADVGVRIYGRFAAALTLTHNASTLILPGGANITTVAGDSFIAERITAGWKVLVFQKATVTGTGGAVQATSPTLVTPILTTPAISNPAVSGTLTCDALIATGQVSLGPRTFPANAGLVTADDMPITGSVLAAATPVGYDFNLDGNPFIRVRATADGAGALTAASSYVEFPTGIKVRIPALSVNTTQVGNITTGEDDLMTFSVPAATLAANGDHLKATLSGSFAANANNKQIKIYFGATAIFATGVIAANGGSWVADVEVIRTGATSQIANVSFHSSNALMTSSALVSTPAETLSGAITLKATGEATATDDITQKTFTCRLVKTP